MNDLERLIEIQEELETLEKDGVAFSQEKIDLQEEVDRILERVLIFIK